MKTTNCSVVGLGKLGACTAACFASRGFNVVGVDINSERVEKINKGLPPVEEPDLGNLIAQNRDRLTATLDMNEAVHKSDITFIVVPTPSEAHGGFSIKYVASTVKEIGKALAQKDKYHLVVVTSTVLPGSTEYGIKPILEKVSNKLCGKDFGICYNPEFIALGTVIRDFLNPDFVLIGESDEKAGNILGSCYKTLCMNNPPIMRMNIINAELAKIALNSFVTTKITFSNMLADICEALPDADVDVVTNAIGLDSRIGRKYLKGGLGYGGPCFPRDNKAFGYLAKKLQKSSSLPHATDEVNNQLVSKVVKTAKIYFRDNCSVGVLGLSYKPKSNVVEESQGLMIAQSLAQMGINIVVYDPLAMENARCILGNTVTYANSPQRLAKESDILIIANNDPNFNNLNANDFISGNKKKVVIDCWRYFRERLSGNGHITYVPLGIGHYNPHLVDQLASMWQSPALPEHYEVSNKI